MTTPERSSLRYEPETDLWHDDRAARVYLECNARSKRAVFLDVTDSQWTCQVNAWTFHINWEAKALKLPLEMIEQARLAALVLLKRRAPNWLSNLRLALVALGELLPEHVTRWDEMTSEDWHIIWTTLRKKDYFYSLRIVYRTIARAEKNSAMLQLYSLLVAYKVGKRPMLEDVTGWNPTRGAFLDEELESLMFFLREHKKDDVQQQVLCLFVWLYLCLGKRPIQIAEIAADGLERVTHKGVTTYFLRVPKAKAQHGRTAEQWLISNDLAEEIQRFSARPEVAAFQRQSNRLLIWEPFFYSQGKRRHTGTLSSVINSFIKEAGLTMQRDRSRPPEPLIFNARRARHTVGTQLARDGAHSEYISRILEHDSPMSARAYIDAVAVFLHEAINRADQALGGIFAGLAENYFSGRLTDELTNRPIFVPDVSNGLQAVGSCSMETELYGECRKHPFYSCFGCVFFLAWREGAFTRARTHVQAQLQFWLDAAGQPERSQMIIEFERLYQGILYTEQLTAERP